VCLVMPKRKRPPEVAAGDGAEGAPGGGAEASTAPSPFQEMQVSVMFVRLWWRGCRWR
jgi:hypothetical protein